MCSLLIEERNKQDSMSHSEEREEFLLRMKISKFKSFFNSDRDKIAPIKWKMDNFKSWFNSARFLNMRSPQSWSIWRTVGTAKIDLRFVAEVDGDNTLLVTICNMSDYDVCFEGTMRAKLTMDTLNIAERVWHALGRRRVQTLVIYPTKSVNISNIIVTVHHHIHSTNQTLCVFGREWEGRYFGKEHGQ